MEDFTELVYSDSLRTIFGSETSENVSNYPSGSAQEM